MKNVISFEETINNEKNSELALYKKENRFKKVMENHREDCWDYNSVSYVSDIHLTHKLQNIKLKAQKKDVIVNVINDLLKESSKIILIGGDVSSDYETYKTFVEELYKANTKLKKEKKDKDIIFVLGNHELWDFKNINLENIIEKYKKLITSNGMHFIHNSLLYYETNNKKMEIKELTEEDLNLLSEEEIRNKVRRSYLIICGGLAFAGYNDKFNANCGIYRDVVNRKTEINETLRFEKIYNKLSNCIPDKNVIILTHNPKNDWSSSPQYVSNWIYVSGHTHHNYYYDDDETRIFSDNQLGYNYTIAHIKNIYLKFNYNPFYNYKDGIYDIKKEEYIDFCIGMRLRFEYSRDGNIYMLKKNNYYCFIKPSKRGLSILNGGALKSLKNKDIKYYYDNMDKQISRIRKPLDKYTEFQKGISDYIKEIGGSGIIHGAIVDIDYFNHIFVNPLDGKLTGYYAYDIVDKYIYSNIPSLLKVRCPQLYKNYKEKMLPNQSNALIPQNQKIKIISKAVHYTNTDMYKYSREIKKMQKLQQGILTSWYDDGDEVLCLEEKNI